MSIISNELPPIGDGDTIKKIIKIIKTVWNIITNKPAKDASKTDSVNDNSSLDNIDRITEIFSDFKEQVHQQATDIEKAIKEEVEAYLDEIRQLLVENQEKAEKYGIRISSIERKIDRILPRIEGVIDHEVSKKVSLDNAECRNIMKMIPGEKKEKALQDFLDAVIQNALEGCCKNIKNNLEEIFDDVDEEIIGAIDFIQNSSKVQMKQLETIDAENYKETTTKLMSEAYFIIDVCEIVDSVL